MVLVLLLRFGAAVGAFLMAKYCFRRFKDTWNMSLDGIASATQASKDASRSEEEVRSIRFFEIYFHWFWSLLRIFWSACWVAIAVFALVQPWWAFWALLGFPSSMALGLIVSWTYMRVAVRRYASRAN